MFQLNSYIQKWLQLFSIVVIIFLIFKLIQSNSEKNIAYRISQKQIELLKENSEELIRSKERQIEYLIQRNAATDIEIKKKQKTIDSLNSLKKEVQVVYVNNIRKIKEFKAKELENYWKNEIK